jgi:hypothetical protein
MTSGDSRMTTRHDLTAEQRERLEAMARAGERDDGWSISPEDAKLIRAALAVAETPPPPATPALVALHAQWRDAYVYSRTALAGSTDEERELAARIALLAWTPDAAPAPEGEYRPDCDDFSCRDHYGDELAWCKKCRASLAPPAAAPPQGSETVTCPDCHGRGAFFVRRKETHCVRCNGGGKVKQEPAASPLAARPAVEGKERMALHSDACQKRSPAVDGVVYICTRQRDHEGDHWSGSAHIWRREGQ